MHQVIDDLARAFRSCEIATTTIVYAAEGTQNENAR